MRGIKGHYGCFLGENNDVDLDRLKFQGLRAVMTNTLYITFTFITFFIFQKISIPYHGWLFEILRARGVAVL